MTAPVRYTAAEMERAALSYEMLDHNITAAMLRQAAAEGQERAAIIDTVDAVAPIGERELLQAVKDEMHDYVMVIRHCSRIYDAVTMGRVSKPTTLPSVVMQIAEELEAERTEEAIKEALEGAAAEGQGPDVPRCGTCKWFQSNPVLTEYGQCWKLKGHNTIPLGVSVPADGSGFCHLHEAAK